MHPHHAPTVLKLMTSTSRNPDQYLQRVGGTYYARVRVPRTLEKYVGQTHIRRSLHTGDKATANGLKHAVVGRLKRELAAMRNSKAGFTGTGIAQGHALDWRESLRAAEAAGDGEQEYLIRGILEDKALEHGRLHGAAKALQWHRTASTTSDTLSELIDQWLALCDYITSTKEGHRKALSEVLAFLGEPRAVPGDVTQRVAMAFIDRDLTQRGLAYNTISDRLASLGVFWKWLASRSLVAPGFNPWAGHKVSKEKNKGRSPDKRSYTTPELLRLLAGNEKVKAWPTYSYPPSLVVLGLFTGARINELCSLTAHDVTASNETYVLHIKDAKTKAGVRYVATTHAAPAAILKRRLRGLKGASALFPELTAGGMDDKLSSSAVKAYVRYRRACDVPDGTDFHSFRRTVITELEAAGVGQVALARFVGHEVGTLAGDTYSQGGNEKNAILTARKVRFTKAVEAAALSLATVK